MADLRRRLEQNVPGDFFVDDTCINCGTCRAIAPDIFGDSGPYAYVKIQPQNGSQRRRALQSLVACPTGSIGSQKGGAEEVLRDFPLQIEEDVYYCGYASPKSFGAASYFIRNPAGNWLTDSPRWTDHLVKRFEELGGLRYIFLTHRDDVADADRYAAHFGAKRIIHEGDLDAVPGAEIVIEGLSPTELSPDFLIIPVPGHTEGHSVLLYKDKFLFTGDHLEWDTEQDSLGAFRDFCWYDWQEQIRSMERLRGLPFEWVLPGHGDRRKLPADRMQAELASLIERMKAQV
jgi:glyoxylase-like metal-dependent hydrolase (beta-lactamase superfamily II)/ferredoxin